MDKHILELKDARLDAALAPACTLYGVLGTESVALLVANSAGEVLDIETWQYAKPNKSFAQTEQDLRRIIAQEPVFNWPFGQKHGVLFHPNITLVPRRLFQHHALPEYFKLLLKPAEYVYAYEELPDFDAYLVQAIERPQARLFNELFPQARLRHQAVQLLHFIRASAAAADHTIFLHFRHQVAQLAVTERQNLLFYNTFSFVTPADLLYYTLLVYDQFKLNPADTPLTVAGNVLRDSELYRILYRFVREIRFAVPPSGFHLPLASTPLPGHCHLELFCLTNL
jgi:hypothetical protein